MLPTKLHISNLKRDLRSLKNQGKADFFPRFFKTGKGEYGEGDIFLGVTVPNARIIAKKYRTISLNEVAVLLHSKIHEERLVALFILVDQFKKSDENNRKTIYDFYLKTLH